MQAYTQVAMQADTHKRTKKDKRGYLDVGWGTQPQQLVLYFVLSIPYSITYSFYLCCCFRICMYVSYMLL